MSSSRGEGRSLISFAFCSRPSVVSPCAERTTTTSSPSSTRDLTMLDGVIELLAALYEYIHCLGISDAAKVVADDVVQTLQQPLVDKGVEKLHLLRAALNGAVDDIL